MSKPNKSTIIDITSINEKIYNLIKQRIINYEYPPGHKITVKELQDELGVSNSPIKDALFRLVGEELVEISSRRGSFVKDVTDRDVIEIDQTRTIIETGAVELSVKKITDQEIENFEKLYQATLMELEEFDYKAFMERDNQFHLAIVEMTCNQRLVNIFKRLNGHMQIVRFRYRKKPKKRLPWTDSDHQEILNTIKARDPDRVKRCLIEHRMKTKSAFLEEGFDGDNGSH